MQHLASAAGPQSGQPQGEDGGSAATRSPNSEDGQLNREILRPRVSLATPPPRASADTATGRLVARRAARTNALRKPNAAAELRAAHQREDAALTAEVRDLIVFPEASWVPTEVIDTHQTTTGRMYGGHFHYSQYGEEYEIKLVSCKKADGGDGFALVVGGVVLTSADGLYNGQQRGLSSGSCTFSGQIDGLGEVAFRLAFQDDARMYASYRVESEGKAPFHELHTLPADLRPVSELPLPPADKVDGPVFFLRVDDRFFLGPEAEARVGYLDPELFKSSRDGLCRPASVRITPRGVHMFTTTAVMERTLSGGKVKSSIEDWLLRPRKRDFTDAWQAFNQCAKAVYWLTESNCQRRTWIEELFIEFTAEGNMEQAIDDVVARTKDPAIRRLKKIAHRVRPDLRQMEIACRETAESQCRAHPLDAALRKIWGMGTNGGSTLEAICRSRAKELVTQAEATGRFSKQPHLGTTNARATRDYPSGAGGQSLECRHLLWRAIAELLLDGGQSEDLAKGLIHALDNIECLTTETLAREANSARVLVWEELVREAEAEPKRRTTIEAIFPKRESKVRAFELFTATVMLSLPLVRDAQAVLGQDSTSCKEAFYGMDDERISTLLRESEGRILSKDSKGASNTLVKIPARIFYEEVLAARKDLYQEDDWDIYHGVKLELDRFLGEGEIHVRARQTKTDEVKLTQDCLDRIPCEREFGLVSLEYRECSRCTSVKDQKPLVAQGDEGSLTVARRFCEAINTLGIQKKPLDVKKVSEYFAQCIDAAIDPTAKGHVLCDAGTGYGKSTLFPIYAHLRTRKVIKVSGPTRLAVETNYARAKQTCNRLAAHDPVSFGRLAGSVSMVMGNEGSIPAENAEALVFNTNYFAGPERGVLRLLDECHEETAQMNSHLSELRAKKNQDVVLLLTATSTPRLLSELNLKVVTAEREPRQIVNLGQVQRKEVAASIVADVVEGRAAKGESIFARGTSYGFSFGLTREIQELIRIAGLDFVTVIPVNGAVETCPHWCEPDPRRVRIFVATSIADSSVNLPDVRIIYLLPLKPSNTLAPAEAVTATLVRPIDGTTETQVLGRGARNGGTLFVYTIAPGKVNMLDSGEDEASLDDPTAAIMLLDRVRVSVADSFIKIPTMNEAVARIRIALMARVVKNRTDGDPEQIAARELLAQPGVTNGARVVAALYACCIEAGLPQTIRVPTNVVDEEDDENENIDLVEHVLQAESEAQEELRRLLEQPEPAQIEAFIDNRLRDDTPALMGRLRERFWQVLREYVTPTDRFLIVPSDLKLAWDKVLSVSHAFFGIDEQNAPLYGMMRHSGPSNTSKLCGLGFPKSVSSPPVLMQCSYFGGDPVFHEPVRQVTVCGKPESVRVHVSRSIDSKSGKAEASMVSGPPAFPMMFGGSGYGFQTAEPGEALAYLNELRDKARDRRLGKHVGTTDPFVGLPMGHPFCANALNSSMDTAVQPDFYLECWRLAVGEPGLLDELVSRSPPNVKELILGQRDFEMTKAGRAATYGDDLIAKGSDAYLARIALACIALGLVDSYKTVIEEDGEFTERLFTNDGVRKTMVKIQPVLLWTDALSTPYAGGQPGTMRASQLLDHELEKVPMPRSARAFVTQAGAALRARISKISLSKKQVNFLAARLNGSKSTAARSLLASRHGNLEKAAKAELEANLQFMLVASRGAVSVPVVDLLETVLAEANDIKYKTRGPGKGKGKGRPPPGGGRPVLEDEPQRREPVRMGGAREKATGKGKGRRVPDFGTIRWTCSGCDGANSVERLVCGGCQTPRPEGAQQLDAGDALDELVAGVGDALDELVELDREQAGAEFWDAKEELEDELLGK